MSEVVADEQKRATARPRGVIGEAVAEVERGAMPSLAKPVIGSGDGPGGVFGQGGDIDSQSLDETRHARPQPPPLRHDQGLGQCSR
jgi:hypothetical protein